MTPGSFETKSGLVFAIALMVLCALAIFHLGTGSRPLSASSVIEALLYPDPKNFDHQIVRNLRASRLLAAIAVGSALGVTGALVQSLIRNPLGEPQFLGLNAGASFAVVTISTLSFPLLSDPFSRPLVAAGGGAALFAMVLFASSIGRQGMTMLNVTLCGIALSAFASSLTSSILILDEDSLQALRTWLAGDLAGANMPLVLHALPALGAGILIAIGLIPRLNALAMGDTIAAGLGVKVRQTRILGLVAAALLTGAAVSIAGPLGFVGLVVPHLARQIGGSDMRVLLPLSILLGASVVLAADIAARSIIAPREIATGIMTAFAGAPVFLFHVARRLK